MDIVWRQTFGRTDAPPDIWWVPRAAQNCGDPKPDGTRGFVGSSGKCLAGDSWIGGMSLVWFGSWQTSALAHEIAHIVWARDGNPPDYNHGAPYFQSGGLVDKATAALAVADLCK